MRKQVEFSLGEKRLIAKELTVRQIQQLFQDPELQTITISFEAIQGRIEKYLP